MQSGRGKLKRWVLKFETKDSSTNPLMGWESSTDTLDEIKLEFETKDTGINPLMGWETSSDTNSELKLEFSSKELALNYAKKNKIDFEIIEPNKRKVVKKSYADNFLK